MSERRIDLVSAGVAFFGLFAVFPALAALISLTGYVADPEIVETAIDTYGELLPPEVLTLIGGQLDRLLAANESTLGLASLISLAVALWSARLGVGGLTSGLTAVYGLPPRSGVWFYLHALGLTLGVMLVGLLAMVLMVLVPLVLTFLVPLEGMAFVVAEGGRWLVGLLVVVAGLALVYRYGPNRKAAPARRLVLWPGLVTAMLLWLLASLGLNLYLAHFAGFNEVYGSIGAVMALMLWFYVAAYAVLLGGVMNAVLEDRGATPDPQPTEPPESPEDPPARDD